MKHATSLILALFLTANVSAGDLKKNTKKHSVETLEVPFDIDLQRTKWTGEHEISNVIAALNKINFTKDQFETTSQYLARTENVNIFPKVPINSLLAFSFSFKDSGSASLCGAQYDADKRELLVSCSVPQLERIYSPEKEKIIETFTFSKVTAVDSKSYVGENNFGVRKRISVRRAKGLGLAIRNLEGISSSEFSKFFLKIELRVPNIDIETAKANMDNIGLLFVGELESPYVLRDSKVKSPTIDEPIDYRGEFQYLNMFMREVWVVNMQNRSVLQRFDRSKSRLE